MDPRSLRRCFRTPCCNWLEWVATPERGAGVSKGLQRLPGRMRAGDPITAEALAAELDCICESPAFGHSPAASTVPSSFDRVQLEGRLGALREIALGIDFFGARRARMIQRPMASVRVEAGRLRHGSTAITTARHRRLSRFRSTRAAICRCCGAGTGCGDIGAQPSVAVLPLPPATPASRIWNLPPALTDEIVCRRCALAAGARPWAGIVDRRRRSGLAFRGTEPAQGRWIVRGHWSKR